jgi:Putative Fe-S cluster
MDASLLMHGAQAVGAVALLGAALGALLGVAARYLAQPADDRCEAIAALLPGSNCAQCGYAGCKQAAAAMVEGRARHQLTFAHALAHRDHRLGRAADVLLQRQVEPARQRHGHDGAFARQLLAVGELHPAAQAQAERQQPDQRRHRHGLRAAGRGQCQVASVGATGCMRIAPVGHSAAHNSQA